MPAAAASLVIGGLVRPRRRRRGNEVREEGEGEKAREERERGGDGGAGRHGLFETSRREWGDNEQQHGEDARSPAPNIGVYSYSFKKSTKSVREGAAKLGEKPAEVFGHMRQEFERENGDQGVNAAEDWRVEGDVWEWGEYEGDVGQAKADRRKQTVHKEAELSEEKLPGAMTVAVLLRTMAKVPLWLIREVIMPIADGVALAWYDAKVLILARGKKGKERYLFRELKGGQSSEQESGWDTGGQVLTEEERQIQQVGRAAKKVVRGFQGGVRRLLRELM